MSKIHDFDFRTGSFIDTVNNRTLVSTGNRKQLKKDLLGYRTISTANLSSLTASVPIKLFDTPITVEAWIKIDKYDATSRYYSVIGEGSRGVVLTYSGVANRIYVINGGSYRGWLRVNLASKGWKHLIFTIPSGVASTINMYLNGIIQTVDATAGTLSPLTTSTVDYNGTTLETGGTSRIVVYDHILSQQEINDRYTDFLRSYPTQKKQRNIEYTKPTDLSREKDSVISNNLLLAGSTTNYHANNVNAWSVYNANTKTQEGNAVKITYVDSTLGANCMLRSVNNTVANDPLIRVKYKLKYRYKVTGTLDIRIYNGAAFTTIANQTNTDWVEREDEFICAVGNNCYMAFLNMSAGEAIWVEFLEFISYQGLVAAYNFKPIKNITVDISGNGKNLTNYLTSATANGIAYSATKQSYSQLASSFNIGTTYSVLIRLTPKSVGNTILGNESTTTNYVGISATQVTYRTATGALNQNISTITLGKEITLVFTREGTTVKTYVDNLSYTGTLSDNTAFSFRNINKLFTGYTNIEMRDLRVYNYVISEQQIKDYHNQFAKEVYLQEDFSNSGADGSSKVPYGWYKGTGVYKLDSMIFTDGTDLIQNTLNTSNGFSALGNHRYSYTTNGSSSTLSKALPTPKGGNFYKLIFTVESNPNGTALRAGDNLGDNFFSATIFTPGTYTYYNKNMRGWQPSGGFFFRVNANQPSGLIISNITLTEESNLPTLINGTKYLECTGAGAISLPSKQAYGTWEFDLYKGSDTNTTTVWYINDRNTISNLNCHAINYGSSESVLTTRYANGVGINNFWSVSDYIKLQIWYRIKIVRTITDVFYMYIKGAHFGDDWVLINTIGGTGTNPYTDTNVKSCEWFTLDLDAGDRIANIIMKKGIEI